MNHILNSHRSISRTFDKRSSSEASSSSFAKAKEDPFSFPRSKLRTVQWRRIKLAVFDIDGTIFRSSLLIELINGLVKAEIFPKKASKEVEKDYLAWLNRAGSYDKYLGQIINIHLKYLGGCKKKKVLEVARKVVEYQKDRVHRYTRDLIKKLKEKKYFLLAISGSPSYMVSLYAKYLGFNAFYGTTYQVKKGVFTGKRISGDSFQNKDRIIKHFLEKRGLKADFKNSVAVGDTESDISMLKMVGKPIAFNPNTVLARHAKRSGWKIVVERKDVIFDIEKFSIIKSR